CVRGEDSQGQAAVLGRLPSSGCGSDSRGDEVQAAGSTVRAMQQGISSARHDAGDSILQSNLRQSGSVNRGQGAGEPDVAGRRRFETLQAAEPSTVPQGENADSQAGWERVRLLRQPETLTRSPYGYGHGEQYVGESRHALSVLSHDRAQPTAFGTRHSAVTLVERVPESAMVYDIQVEGTHCFFANGLLVHNCIIWDDPHSAEGANSPAEREEAVRIFKETLPTRLVEPKTSAIVIVMQRLHELDVSGEILSGDYGYEHLMLPMEFEP